MIDKRSEEITCNSIPDALGWVHCIRECSAHVSSLLHGSGRPTLSV